jgi:hypothetical protein
MCAQKRETNFNIKLNKIQLKAKICHTKVNPCVPMLDEMAFG